MRPLGWIGVILLIAGAVIASGKVPYRTSTSEMQMGPMKVSSNASEYIPPAIGIIAIVAGGLLIFAGRKPR